jgi:chromosome segregation ATPase
MPDLTDLTPEKLAALQPNDLTPAQVAALYDEPTPDLTAAVAAVGRFVETYRYMASVHDALKELSRFSTRKRELKEGIAAAEATMAKRKAQLASTAKEAAESESARREQISATLRETDDAKAQHASFMASAAVEREQAAATLADLHSKIDAAKAHIRALAAHGAE